MDQGKMFCGFRGEHIGHSGAHVRIKLVLGLMMLPTSMYDSWKWGDIDLVFIFASLSSSRLNHSSSLEVAQYSPQGVFPCALSQLRERQ